jgi:hypothetical protein
VTGLGPYLSDTIAAIAFETGISPVDLMNTPPEVFEALYDLVKRRLDARKQAEQSRKTRR